MNTKFALGISRSCMDTVEASRITQVYVVHHFHHIYGSKFDCVCVCVCLLGIIGGGWLMPEVNSIVCVCVNMCVCVC